MAPSMQVIEKTGNHYKETTILTVRDSTIVFKHTSVSLGT